MKQEKRGASSLTGLTLFFRGIVFIVVGFLLFVTSTLLPRVVIRVAVYCFLVSSFLRLRRQMREETKNAGDILLTLLELIVLLFLAGADATTAVPLYLFGMAMGCYQVFLAVVNGMTYYLRLKNQVTPRRAYLIDGIWMGLLGFGTLFSSNGRPGLQVLFVAGYLMLYGWSLLREGLFFHWKSNKGTKRHVRVSLPLAVAAFIPQSALRALNRYVGAGNSSGTELTKKGNQNPDMTVFIHVSDRGIGTVGHVDLSYQGFVYGYGPYDVSSLHLFGAIGDGVLYRAKENDYLPFCTQEGMTVFAYSLALTEPQKQAVEDQLQALLADTVPWTPTQMPHKKWTASKELLYAYRLMNAVNVDFFKFTRSAFKTYFVMSTNCVLLADTILGQAGTDILNVKGFIAPGTYQAYLDQEYERPNSFVVARKVYTGQSKEEVSR